MTVRLQTEDFDIASEIDALTLGNHAIGAVVTFTGLVRDMLGDARITDMTLEHYPAMAQAELERIEREAATRWPALQGSCIIHRHGTLLPGDRIVLVVTVSSHRQVAFEAAEFIMDYLKTRAPFWKKESLASGDSGWVSATDADDAALNRWQET
ncbi:molybdopterin synthase subunit MoaE [Cohaesibacter sp. ES.047]|uniref:molybdenum cofactor biosynthesis protein MoaE n=1 Tax=Cohaesibacter sp. ES.047 TaxID=1798205 RepID=UPI000BB75EA3|nr:molybdenum cofactor biosynthesis protein MoaE [Cohaesibacter sp. ES.047]SNY91511.1 molybdopterin synthase subunit MoaE [Cohaesibacter sp. ES.047]